MEEYDPTSRTATKAGLFRERLIAPRVPRLGADTLEDAVAICLDTHGTVDVAQIARLLGDDDHDRVLRDLLERALVFEDPHGEDPVPRAAYLSGNVRDKLRAAESAAAGDPDRFTGNVAELSRVLPADVPPDDIEVRLGGWIGLPDVQDFFDELLPHAHIRITNPGAGMWKVRGHGFGVAATDTWGTPEVPAPRLAELLLRQAQIKVTLEDADGKQVIDVEATEAAIRTGTQLQERFNDWAWETPDRAERLAREYNDRFNALVLRSYDDVELSLPGLARRFTPRPHQVAAVARMINEPAVGLFHVVGAGKSAEMAMGVMELRRLGLVNKPAVCVPNHLVAQFTAEFLRTYPTAKVLAASLDDMGSGDRRARFLGRVVNNDWDAVVFSRESFKKIPVGPDAQATYIRHELDQLRALLGNATAQGAAGTVKQIETKILRHEELIKRKLDSDQDVGLTFEQSGIDYVVVDEAHDYKNLRTVSNYADLAITGSQRSDDLLMKLTYLRQTRGERVATFATGTPVANSMTELHVMQRYLRPDLLHQAGLSTFDEWAATFSEPVTSVEVAPTGGGFRVQTRTAKFRNVPELMQMFHVAGDVKMAEDLNLPRPALAGGTVQVIAVPATDELLIINAEVTERALRSGGRGHGPDNILALMAQLRKAALDVRLTGVAPSGPQKVDRAADRIAAVWRDHAADVFSTSPTPGALQLVFADTGVPSGDPDRFDVYTELKAQLIARGMPAERVAFVHDANNDTEKAALFARCRTGQVAVLIGSTQKMGTGTNVQHRAIALHHLDSSWRPADIEQREGRIIRQGNENPEVQIYCWTTEQSFDSYMWQTVERKARFIGQVMRGTLDVRQIDDIGEQAMTAGHIKAVTVGNPLLLEQAELQAQVQQLVRQQRVHDRSQRRMTDKVVQHDHAIRRYDADTARLTAAVARTVQTRGDTFRAVVARRTYDTRAEAGAAVAAAVRRHLDDLTYTRQTHPAPIADLGGHTVLVHATRHTATDLRITFALHDVPRSEHVTAPDVLDSPGGLITRLENRVHEIPLSLERIAQDRAAAARDRDLAHATLGQPFPDTTTLAAARDRLATIDSRLTQDATTPPSATTDPAVPPLSPPVDGPTTPATTADPLDAHTPTSPDDAADLARRASEQARRIRQQQHRGRDPDPVRPRTSAPIRPR